MNNKTFRLRRAWASAGVTLLLLVAFFTVTPVGRAWAQELIHFFIPEESNTVQLSTEAPAPLVEVQPNAPAAPAAVPQQDCNEAPFPSCSLDEVKNRVQFTIAYPAKLPEGYQFSGAKLLDDGVLLTFGSPKGSYHIFQSPLLQEGLRTSPVGSKAEVVATTVNGRLAEYVEGSWMGATQDGGKVPWNDNDYLRTLAWADDSLQYRLVSVGAKINESARPSVDEMVAVAASIDPATPLPALQAAGSSLAEAEKQAGFAFTQPGFLPPATFPARAVYNPANAVICNYYEDAHGNDGVMILAESTAGLWSPYDFKVSAVDNGTGKMIEIQMAVEHVEMQGVLNGKAIYMSNGIRPGKLCGNEDDIANHALIWHKDGRSYYLFGLIDNLGYGYVTRMELEALANDLAGLPAKEKQVDPERVQSLVDAELLWGNKVPFPTKMIAGMNFDHIHVWRDKEQNPRGMLISFVKQPVVELVQVYISANDTQSLDGYKGHTYYSEATIWGSTGFVSTLCTEDAVMGAQHCQAEAVWLDGNGMRYYLDVRSGKPITKEQALEIAESMQR